MYRQSSFVEQEEQEDENNGPPLFKRPDLEYTISKVYFGHSALTRYHRQRVTQHWTRIDRVNRNGCKP